MRKPKATGRFEPMRRRRQACQALACLSLCLVLTGGSAWSSESGAAAAGGEGASPATAAEPHDPPIRANPAGAAPARIKVYFKLDPHLTRGLYLGERWVSPPTYTSVPQPGRQAVVEARTEGQDARGRRLIRHLAADWRAADPDMVTVSAGPGHGVRITVHRAGESTLEVSSGGASKTLSIQSIFWDQEDRTQVRISQVDRH